MSGVSVVDLTRYNRFSRENARAFMEQGADESGAAALLEQIQRRTGLAFTGVDSPSRVLPRLAYDERPTSGRDAGSWWRSGSLDESHEVFAADAQPALITMSNAGIPATLSNYLDPKLVEVLYAPMKFAVIAGEVKRGDWTTTVVTIPVIESEGQVSAYGDFNANGSVEANANFPQFQTYHYQTFTQWGEKQLANAALAKIDWASRMNIASALILNKFQNQTYALGVAGLQTFGLLNHPLLSAALAPTTTWASATPDLIFADAIRIYQQLQAQANGTVDTEARIVLALSPTNEANLHKTNTFNVNVYDQLRKNFPNLRVETAPEYTTPSGELVQMIVEEVEGQETLSAGFTEKMRVHAMVPDTSSWKQKKSQGTIGMMVFRPALVAQMLG